jgi:hypothetical protein
MGLVKYPKMSTIPELAAQIDAELCKDRTDADHLLTLLEQITTQISTPEGCEDLNDLVFDLVPTIILPGSKSKACENAVKQLLQAAAEKCVPREVYSALAAALSESMQNIGVNQIEAIGASSLEFQRFLLEQLTNSLLRLKQLSTSFLREHLLLATNWCHCAQEEQDYNDNSEEDIKCVGEEGFCSTVASIIEAITSRTDFTTEEERNAAQQLLCSSILQVTASALELPFRLERATEAAQTTLLEAQSTLTGKLYRFQPLLLKLLSDGPERILSLLIKAPPEFGIMNLEDLFDFFQKQNQVENGALGAAAAVCSSILHSSLQSSGASENRVISLKYKASSTGKMLTYVFFTLNTLTDAAAQHHSVPLALLPLLTVSQYSRQLGVNGTSVEESYVALAMPIISTLVAVMSLNPVEIVRTCAYEALQTFLDAMVPQARFLVLQNMTTSSSTTVIAAVALQRLRLEISSAVLQPPFTHATALQLALPWIKKDASPPGWETEEDVMHNADVLAAALSVLRFILLQRIAMSRHIIPEEGEEEKEEETAASAGEDPVQLQPEKLQILLNEHLKPLFACTGNIIRRTKEQNSSNSNQQIDGDLEVFLAMPRLEEVLERTLDAAKELIQS